MAQRKKVIFELGVEIFLAILVTVLLVISYQPQRYLVTTGNNMGPFVFPRIILYLFLALLAFDGVRLAGILKRGAKNQTGEKVNLLPKPVVLTLASVIVYAFLWNAIGFTLSTVLFLTIETKIVNNDVPFKNGLLVAIISTVILTIVFVILFKMEFPEPILDLLLG